MKTYSFLRGISRWGLVLVSFVLSMTGVSSQQLPDRLLRNDAYPGLGAQCAQAMNTTVASCPGFLSTASSDLPRLDTPRLQALCTPACRTALASARGVIAAGCRAATDVIEMNNVVYPATLIIDKWIYTYDISCAKDRHSGRFCDEMYHEALANGTKADSCSDCSLSVVKTQLNSPFGYDPEFAEGFQSVTAKCGASGYAFTSPAPYAISTKPYPVPTDAPTCGSPYVVQAGETCDSIATAKNISTHSVVKAGNTDPDCTTLQAGAQLCLPDPCTVYRVKIDDTCESILASVDGLRANDLLTWNPNIDVLCTNIAASFEKLICVSPHGRTLDQVTRVTDAPTATQAPPTVVPRPTNAKAESHARCAGWYEIQTGDYCQAISIREGISLRDFYFLNPSVDSPDCLNLWRETSYCVRAVGDINTYSGYPYSTSPAYTLTSSSYVTTTEASLTTVEPIATPIVELPLAPGSLSAEQGCVEFTQYHEIIPQMDQSVQPDLPVSSRDRNSCGVVCAVYGVFPEDFLLWNPSLQGLSDCQKQPGLRYCAKHADWKEAPLPPLSNRCSNITQPYPGTISTCSCFIEIIGFYDVGVYLCEDIARDFKTTVDDLVSWNPWIGPPSSCDAGLHAGLERNALRPVCVRAGGSSTSVPTQTTGTTTGPPSTTTSSVVPPGPTQPGIVAGCRKYHLAVDGDGCWVVANKYGIELDDFYAWNPAVGTGCTDLWLDYAYCVQGPAASTSMSRPPPPTTTTTSGGVPPPGPTQPGSIASCKRWHLVVSGDGCWAIQQKYGIPDFATLLRWNPGIGNDCQELWRDYHICVGV